MTIKDVAKMADVSVTTVSMVLNNKPVRVSAQKREAILWAAKELGYNKRRYIAKERSNKNEIGLILPDIAHVFYSELAKGILKETAELGYSLTILDSDENAEGEMNNLRTLRNIGVKGIIMCLSAVTAVGNEIRDLINEISEWDKIPVVLIDRQNPEFNCHSVVVNHYIGGTLAARHLVENLHKKIGCITGGAVSSSIDRVNGFISVIEKSGPEYTSFIVDGDYSLYSGYELCSELIKNKVTAIFTCNDVMAIGAFRKLCENKIRVPEDISLIGFDDIQFASMLAVPLTTIRQPTHMLCKKAVSLVHTQTERSSNEKNTIIIMPELIIRDSVIKCK